MGQGEGLGGAAGMIERIYMENFMCHKKYEVVFDRGINFIIGENGRCVACLYAVADLISHIGSCTRRPHCFAFPVFFF